MGNSVATTFRWRQTFRFVVPANLLRAPSVLPKVKPALRRLFESPIFALTAVVTAGRRHRRQRPHLQRGQRHHPEAPAVCAVRRPWSACGMWPRASWPGRSTSRPRPISSIATARRCSRTSVSGPTTRRPSPAAVTPSTSRPLFVTDGTLGLLGVRPSMGRRLQPRRRPAHGPRGDRDDPRIPIRRRVFSAARRPSASP